MVQPPTLHSQSSSRNLHKVVQFDDDKTRFDYLPAGIASIVFFGLLIWVLTNIQPKDINDFLFPNGFVLITLVIVLFFSSGILFATLNLRRAMMWGVCLTAVVWMQLQHVLDPFVFLYVVFPFICIELVLTFLRKK